jgi:hypothetical protein
MIVGRTSYREGVGEREREARSCEGFAPRARVLTAAAHSSMALVMRKSIAVLVMVLATSACTDVLPPDDDDNGDFTVSVGSGLQPSYSWSGGNAQRVDVVDVEDPLFPVWGIASTGNSIQSPVQHGTVPAGATELSDEQRSLRAGERYRVNVTLANGQRGSREFQR